MDYLAPTFIVFAVLLVVMIAALSFQPANPLDATIDDFGLWIVYSNNTQEEVPSALKIPGTHVRYVGENGRKYLFDLYAEPAIRMAASGEFGETLRQRCQG